MTKIIFRDLQKHFDWDLRANPINSCYTENFEVLLKKWKIDDFDAHFLIWSNKIPKGVCIYYERSIFWLSKKHNSFYLWLLELYIFFDSEN